MPNNNALVNLDLMLPSWMVIGALIRLPIMFRRSIFFTCLFTFFICGQEKLLPLDSALSFDSVWEDQGED